MIKVFGHKSPDTDAICSPIVYAWYLKKKGIDAEAFVPGKLNKETGFVLENFKVSEPKVLSELKQGDEVAILDTNNPEELPENIGTLRILNVIDHHKLAGLSTDSPLSIVMKPVGCTATIVYQLLSADGIKPDSQMAGLLLSAILSDTLKFTSPTTTAEDKKAAEDLVKIANINIDAHAEAMFAAKSDLSGMSARDVLYMDSKVFDFVSRKVRISSLETTKPENAKKMIKEISQEMEKTKKEEKLDSIYFFIIDILETNAELFVSSNYEKNIAEKAFGKKFQDEFMALPGVVSRKKQIVPTFEKVYA